MAGIQGQPGTKPSQVESPIPGATQTSAFDAAEIPAAKTAGSGSAFDAAEVGQAAPPEMNTGYTGPGADLLQKTADVMPTALGLVGGIAGAPGGTAVMVPLAGCMAAAGMGYRQFIEQEILGKPIKDVDKMLKEITDSAGKTGAELLAGEAVFKGAKAIGGVGKAALKSEIGQALTTKITETAAPAIQYISDFTGTIKKQIIAPVTDFIEANMAKGTAEASGDTIKESFTARISTKFNQFKQRYADINNVSNSTPLTDEARYALTNKLRSDAVDMPNNITNMVKGYANRIDGASNAQQIHEVIADVNTEIARMSQYQTSNAVRDKIGALQQFSDRATDYMENFTYGIAKRIANGKATMPEMQSFERMMVQQANPTVAVGKQNLEAYAKSVAKDYIEQRTAINADYAKFRRFLEDVSEQTKVGVEKRGPMQFLRDIQEVPSEQLVERMFLPKNAAALRDMAETSPEIFAAVKQARIRSVYNDSMVKGQIDLNKLADNFTALPEASRELIMPAKEIARMRAIGNSGGLKAIDRLANNMAMNVVRGVVDITHMSTLAGAKILKDSAGIADKVLATPVGNIAGKQATGAAVGAGKAYQSLSDTYYPGSQR